MPFGSDTISSHDAGDTSDFQSYRLIDDDIADDESFGNADARFLWFQNRMLPARFDWRKTHNVIKLDRLFEGDYR